MDNHKPWWVRYSIFGFGDQVRGYDTLEEALLQKRDIEGFAGVSNVRIEDKRPTLLQRLCSED